MTRIILSLTLMANLLALSASADLMKDSPVKFPEKGALPAKFPPDRASEQEPTEEGY